MMEHSGGPITETFQFTVSVDSKKTEVFRVMIEQTYEPVCHTAHRQPDMPFDAERSFLVIDFRVRPVGHT